MKPLFRSALAGILLLPLCDLLAQEPAPAAAKPAAPAAEPPRIVTKEQTIFVPFEKLEEVFGKQDQGIFLPYREFLEMWNKVNLPETLKKKEPPVEGVLAGAAYVGKVEGDVATIQAKLTFEALKQGWSKLAIGAPGLPIAQAKSTAILSAAAGGYEVLFPDKGSYVMDATLYGKVNREPGMNTLHLQLPKTAVAQFELTIPEKGLEFKITPASAYTAVENPDGTTKLLVYFGSSEQVDIGWSRKTGETALKPLLFVDAATVVRIGPGSLRTETELDYQILRSGVDALDILAPAGDQVLSVDGQNIKEWTVQPGGANQPQKVHVSLYTPAKEKYLLKLRLERALGALPQKAPLPLIQADKVERQSGTIAIHAANELVVEVAELQELTQQAPAPAANPKAEDRSLVGEYRYLRLPYAGNVAISEAKPQIDITSETLALVEPETLGVRSVFHFDVKKAGIFSAQIELPPGLMHVEATGDGIDTAKVQKLDARDVLVVKFTGRRVAQFDVTVTADAPRDKPDAPLTAPVFNVRNVERQEAKVGVAIHVSLKANTTDRGDLHEEDIRQLSALPIAHPDLTPLTLGFRYRGVAKPAQVAFELRKPRVSAEVLTALEVRETLMRHTWTIEYDVEYVGVSEFSVQLPAVIANDVQIEGDNIKERTKVEEKDAKGKPTGAILWKITLQDKVLGAYELKLTHDTPRAEQKPGATATVTLQTVRPIAVFRETGQISVIKDGNLEITATDAKGFELMDPKELAPQLQSDGVFLAYKYTGQPGALTLQVAKNLYLAVPPVVVTYAVLTSVVAEDEAETTEVIYWVRNNAQQFFSIQLPSRGDRKAKLLSDAFVAGEPQQPSRRPDRNEVLIRLPARQESGEAFPVRFVYEVPSSHPGQKLGWRGRLHLDPPQLAGDASTAIDILQTKWTLFLPSEHRYLHFTGAMRTDIAGRGWDEFRSFFNLLVPKFGPAPASTGFVAQSEPTPLPPAKTPGFDTQLQREGAEISLRRLDAPAAIGIVYESKGFAATTEAIACLLALAAGICLLGCSRRSRFLYFVIAGLGALVIAGAVDPRGARFWESIYLGVFLAALVWFAACLWKGLRSVRLPAFRRPRPSAPPVPPVAAATPDPTPSEPAATRIVTPPGVPDPVNPVAEAPVEPPPELPPSSKKPGSRKKEP